MLLMGCTAIPEPSIAPTNVQVLTLPTHQFTGAGGVVYGVTLRAGGGCLWLEGDIARYSALWPAGFSGRGNPVQLVGPDGRVIAVEGDRREVDATDRKGFLINSCQVAPQVLIVGQVVSVNGTMTPPTPVPATPQNRPPIR